jgi:hypothetical protein
MSIAVALSDLRSTAAPYGDAAFLLTVGEDGRPHLSHVRVRYAGQQLLTTAGQRSRGNASERPLVTLLWPPHAPGGFSLVVDAGAAVDGDDIVLTPTKAVLHRPA